MKYPKLVRRADIPVRVVIQPEDINEYGEREVILDKTFLCNYQDVAKVKHAADKQYPEVAGTILIDGDILESLEIVTNDFGITANGTLVLVNSNVDDDGVCMYEEHEAPPDIPITGYVYIFGRRRKIKAASKARNFDGSVNYTRLDVI